MNAIEKYRVGIVEMIRNNNIATGQDKMNGHNVYFMLDYFDLLFHRDLTENDKIYRKFWNIKENQENKDLDYKAAYKILSLYADSGKVKEDPFKVCADAGYLSARPFLGIIQINFVHYLYKKDVLIEELFSACEREIEDALQQNILGEDTCYQLYRSSTSGDFCLVVKSANVEQIYKISTLINNFVVHYSEEIYRFNTYTNVGIECSTVGKGKFVSFRKETVEKNKCCKFAIRITTYNKFAQRIFNKIKKSNEVKVIVEPMDGLFGRYDFLLHLSMDEFAQIYGTLCASKITGCNADGSDFEDDDEKTLVQLLRGGVEEGKIRVINERVLVPLSGTLFDLNDVDINGQQFADREKELRDMGKVVNKELKEKMKRLQKMEYLFIEERRCFIDISRELWEVINTYVPQGMEDDSHVNWQILVSDLNAAFEAIEQWKKSYEKCKDFRDQKHMREVFLENLRLITEAINQYYKFLQNVNSQTWQSPLYEIQTQLDAEKMMIAYREFFYEYLYHYKMSYATCEDRRPVFYPIVYPDMSIERVCVAAPFLNEMNLSSRLLICRVPSFEYYGRVFDMIPWILHEASHCIRTMKRKERNEYLIKLTVRAAFSQAMYKLLNHYSNDYGYHALGALENEVLDCITDVVAKQFCEFCRSKKEDLSEIGINYLETELIEFLNIFFDHEIFYMDEGEDARNIQKIQEALLKFLACSGQLESEEHDVVDMIRNCVGNEDIFSKVVKVIYENFYYQIAEEMPKEDSWEMLRKDSWSFEIELEKNRKKLEEINVAAAQLQDYCFTVRELNRLFGAWHKRQKNDVNKKIRERMWEACIHQIRDVIQKGFDDNKGFTELYRIFNMLFDGGDQIDAAKAERIGTEFDILFREEVYMLAEREITTYRESCADLFMAAALGLDAFGYCRQMFQTASDAAPENNTKWTEAINVHRFRVVTAVLLGQEYPCVERAMGSDRYIPINILLRKGKEYCLASLECAQKSILRDMKKTENEAERKSIKKNDDIQKFFRILQKNVCYIFDVFGIGVSIENVLENSVLSVCLNLDAYVRPKKTEVEKKREVVRKMYQSLKEELDSCRHIMYRIKCFITILSLIGDDRYIVVKEEEYQHLLGLYKTHFSKCQNMRENEICRVVSSYYNNPESAHTKNAAEMLDDTIQFIQTYYYKNRFNTMLFEKK